MFQFLIPMAIGAGIGALTNKNPLRGAATGAAMGAGAGALGGGLLGASGATGATGATAAATPASSVGVMPALPDAASMGFGGEPQGLLGTLQGYGSKVAAAGKAAEPFVNAASLGVQTAGLLSPQQEPLASAPPPQMAQGGAQTLGQLAQGQTDPLAQRRMQAMMQRQSVWGG